MADKRDRLALLCRMWSKCASCELSTYRSKVVEWRGNPEAKLMMVGEAPGGDEDEQGIPFVGQAGRTLDELMDEADLSQDRVFICNMIACRPPGNRVPLSAELAACRPRLDAMIWITQPEVIVTLGSVSASRIVGVRPITSWRGNVVDMERMLIHNKQVHNCVAVPTFHPSYLNRQGNNLDMRRQIVGDLKKAAGIAYGKASDKT